MTDSIACFPPGWRALDANGVTIPGAKLKFFNSGTSTPKTVYSDEALTVSLGTVVTCDAGGYPTSDGSAKVVIYTGTALYKLTITTSDDVTVASHDAIKGAPAIPATSDSALPETPVVTKTTTYSVVAADQGKVINANPTGGSFAITLLDAATAGDGYRVTIRHAGVSTANTVTVRTNSEAISYAGKSVTSFALTGYGHSVTLVSDGAAYHVDGFAPPMMIDGVPFVRITDRLTAPPSSPTAGARYIVNGTATGVWSTLSFAQHDIAEADGNGSWIKYTPASGTLAYVVDEALYSSFNGTAWVDQTGMGAPSSSTLQCAVFEHQLSNGTAGGTGTGSAWTARTLNTSVKNTITGCSLASNQVTLPVGTYLVDFWQSFAFTTQTQVRLKVISGTATPDPILGPVGTLHAAAANDSDYSLTGDQRGNGVLTVTATAVVELQYWWAGSAGGSNTMGAASAEPGNSPEVYAGLTILSLAALQGPAGTQGAQGPDGLDAAFAYQWNTATSGDPGSGKIRGNNATVASITELAFSETDLYAGSMAAVLATFDDSTSSVRARVRISKEGATGNFHLFSITGAGTDQGAYWTFPVTYVATSGTIANSDNCAVLIVEKGDKGDTGSTGATGSAGAAGATGATGPNTGLDFAFNTATSGDPGSGKVLYNNATLGSVTQINISKTGRNAESLGTLIGTFDDSNNTAHRGRVRIFTVADRTKFADFSFTGTFTDNTTYWSIPVSAVDASGTLHANNDVLAVMFERTGNKGTDGAGTGDVVGPASATDNAIARFDTTTGKLLQDSGVTIDDSNNVAGAVSVSATQTGAANLPAITGTHSGAAVKWSHTNTNYYGSLGTTSGGGSPFVGLHAEHSSTANTIKNSGAGVRGCYATYNGTTLDFIFNSDATANADFSSVVTGFSMTTAGALTLAGALSIGTSNAFTGGTIELGHASDTTISRTGAGAIAVEGVGVALNSTSRVHTASTIELGHASDTTLSRSAAGELAVEGTVVKKVGKETIFIPAGAMTARTTNGAASGTTELATNDIMLRSLDFDTTTEEGAGFMIAMPKSWNESTVTFKAFWTAASGSGGVAWGLAAYALSDDDAMDTAVSGQQVVTDTLLTANDMHISSESSAITIGGTPANGDVVYFEVTREVANGSDTIAADAKLIGLHIYITTNASTDA